MTYKTSLSDKKKTVTNIRKKKYKKNQKNISKKEQSYYILFRHTA